MGIKPKISFDIESDNSEIVLYSNDIAVSTLMYKSGTVVLSAKSEPSQVTREQFLQNHKSVNEWKKLTLDFIPQCRDYLKKPYEYFSSKIEVNEDLSVSFEFKTKKLFSFSAKWNKETDTITIGERARQIISFQNYLLLNESICQFVKIINNNTRI